jgi:hypothetical protein
MNTDIITHQKIADLRKVVLGLQREEETLLVCEQAVIHAYKRVFHYKNCTREFGQYAGPDRAADRQNRPYPHHWLRFADGTILDPTANQFGDDDPIRIVPLDDPRQTYYYCLENEDDIVAKYIPWGPGQPAFDWFLELVAARKVYS